MASTTLDLSSDMNRVLDMAECLDLTYDDPRGDMNFVFIGTEEAINKIEAYANFCDLTEDMSNPDDLASDIDNSLSRGQLVTLWNLIEEFGDEDEYAIMNAVAAMM
jgi:hypothetical protein